MAKDDLIDVQGTVVAVHSGGLYRVECDPGHEVLAQLSGKMRRFRIKVVPGDRVTVGVSPYGPGSGNHHVPGSLNGTRRKRVLTGCERFLRRSGLFFDYRLAGRL